MIEGYSETEKVYSTENLGKLSIMDMLAYFEQHYRLVILSNIDRISYASSRRRLGVDFESVLTAEDIGSYKPDVRNFEYLLDRLGELGYSPHSVLHTAQSLYHDHVPANRLDHNQLTPQAIVTDSNGQKRIFVNHQGDGCIWAFDIKYSGSWYAERTPGYPVKTHGRISKA